jgi:eukaryotic-like serine/threonine-protein kinase
MSAPDVEKYRTAGQIFDDLIDRPQAERDLRLAQMAREDPAMAQFVRELLAADAHPATTLDEGPRALAPSVIENIAVCDDTGESAPQASVIGPYRVLSLIGRGGMGEVLLAERADGQYEQKVAIKLLKRGMDSERVLKRFLQERRILARLNHPNIARLLDGGMTEDGLPYFVMEYVEGEPITDFAKAWKLDTRGRVELMLHVCEAVEFAHRNLIVHRDLKPSNILVGASGGLKLLDFGIAKFLTESHDDSLTDTGTRVMTPAYAAPEQILGEPITTSTDVYTLGLLLYELLIGKLPARGRERSGEDTMSHDSIERPSALLRRQSVLPDITPRERAKRARELRGDLDTIVLRALRREPERRYASAGALADDLRRWLDGRPVSARRDSRWYRFRKFVSRHRAGVAAGTAAVTALLVGMSLALWQARVARDEARNAQRVTEFLVSIFQAADPVQKKGEDLTAQEILDAAVARLPVEFADAPLARADLQLAIAEIRLNRSNHASAREAAEAALATFRELAPADTLREVRVQRALGTALRELGEHQRSREALDRAVALLRALDQPELLSEAIESLSATVHVTGAIDDAIALQNEALAIERAAWSPGDPRLGDTLHGLAVLYEEAGRYEDAEQAYRDALAAMQPWGELHPLVLRCQGHFAALLDRRGKRDESKLLFEQALAGQTRVFGAGGTDTAETHFHYGIFLSGMRDHAGAERAYRNVLASEGASVITRAHAWRYLGIALTSQERYAEAVAPLREAEMSYAKLFGESDGQRYRAQANRGYAMTRANDAAGLIVQREAVAGIGKSIGEEAYELIKPLVQLGQCEREAGNARDALAAHERALAIATKSVGADHVMTHEAQYEIALDALALDDAAARAKARPLIDTAVAARRARDDSAVLGPYLLASAELAHADGDGARAKREAREARTLILGKYPATHARAKDAEALLRAL